MATNASMTDLTKYLTIVVGDSEKRNFDSTFLVPEAILTEKSEFFKAVCRNPWKEATRRVIELPEVDSHMFNYYLLWCYGKGLVNPYHEEQLKPQETECKTMLHLASLWILSDQLANVELRNAIVSEMLYWIEEGDADITVLFSRELIELIWSSKTPNRSLRRLILGAYIAYAGPEDLKASVAEFSADFLQDLVLLTFRIVDGETTVAEVYPEMGGDACWFHEHDEGNPRLASCHRRTKRKERGSDDRAKDHARE